MKRVVLCGKPGGCCPEVRLYGDEVVIEDDYANEIRMSREQFDVLKEKIESGEFD